MTISIPNTHLDYKRSKFYASIGFLVLSDRTWIRNPNFALDAPFSVIDSSSSVKYILQNRERERERERERVCNGWFQSDNQM